MPESHLKLPLRCVLSDVIGQRNFVASCNARIIIPAYL